MFSGVGAAPPILRAAKRPLTAADWKAIAAYAAAMRARRGGAQRGAAGMGEYFAQNGMGEYFSTQGLGADDMLSTTDPKILMAVSAAVGLGIGYFVFKK